MGKNKSRKTDMGLSKRKESNMKKWLFSIFVWVIAFIVVVGGVFLVFYDPETLLLYGALSACLCASLFLITIGLANMPNKGEGK